MNPKGGVVLHFIPLTLHEGRRYNYYCIVMWKCLLWHITASFLAPSSLQSAAATLYVQRQSSQRESTVSRHWEYILCTRVWYPARYPRSSRFYLHSHVHYKHTQTGLFFHLVHRVCHKTSVNLQQIINWFVSSDICYINISSDYEHMWSYCWRVENTKKILDE
jgi:hypothetical protein